jgi:hypothetical protein
MKITCMWNRMSTPRRHIPGDSNLHSCRLKNLIFPEVCLSNGIFESLYFLIYFANFIYAYCLLEKLHCGAQMQ